MWELDHKESWVLKNWCFWTVVLEKTLESPLDCKEIHPKGNQSWIFIGRTDAETEAPILWPPDATNWLLGKDPDAGKDWRQEKKVTTEDEMVGWHHWLDGHESEQDLGGGDGQGSQRCCSPWGHKELDTTEWLNWIDSRRGRKKSLKVQKDLAHCFIKMFHNIAIGVQKADPPYRLKWPCARTLNSPTNKCLEMGSQMSPPCPQVHMRAKSPTVNFSHHFVFHHASPNF